VPQAELACGRVGDDVDGMAVQLDRPALRLLSGLAAYMTTSWCICMARESSPHAFRWRCSCLRLVQRVMAHALFGVGGSSCEAETCRARLRLVRGDPPLGTGRRCCQLVGIVTS
jgi:hypothetical protein